MADSSRQDQEKETMGKLQPSDSMKSVIDSFKRHIHQRKGFHSDVYSADDIAGAGLFIEYGMGGYKLCCSSCPIDLHVQAARIHPLIIHTALAKNCAFVNSLLSANLPSEHIRKFKAWSQDLVSKMTRQPLDEKTIDQYVLVIIQLLDDGLGVMATRDYTREETKRLEEKYFKELKTLAEEHNNRKRDRVVPLDGEITELTALKKQETAAYTAEMARVRAHFNESIAGIDKAISDKTKERQNALIEEEGIHQETKCKMTREHRQEVEKVNCIEINNIPQYQALWKSI